MSVMGGVRERVETLQCRGFSPASTITRTTPFLPLGYFPGCKHIHWIALSVDPGIQAADSLGIRGELFLQESVVSSTLDREIETVLNGGEIHESVPSNIFATALQVIPLNAAPTNARMVFLLVVDESMYADITGTPPIILDNIYRYGKSPISSTNILLFTWFTPKENI
ncbi:hypothetical protein B0H19DRAFT_1081317 [Mycena capillaripes]|nr:hypothetical protein B0H19DRAFT_1081240 [Mycena capillaripes]KAJ6533145.1 hypothetical protein B0H19DRAFT_1081317 [Mycena capillaripes]